METYVYILHGYKHYIQEHVQEERLKRPYEVFSEDMMMYLQLAGAQQ